MLETINQVKKIEKIKMMTKNAFKIFNCIICAVSKMHKIINKNVNNCVIKFFQILHFDLTINNINFDKINCIAHFTNEFIFFN